MQELRQWQREWREENRAKTTLDDRRSSTDDKPSTPTPPSDAPAATTDDSSQAKLPHTDGDTEDKTATDDRENTARADDTKSPTENTKPEPFCQC